MPLLFLVGLALERCAGEPGGGRARAVLAAAHLRRLHRHRQPGPARLHLRPALRRVPDRLLRLGSLRLLQVARDRVRVRRRHHRRRLRLPPDDAPRQGDPRRLPEPRGGPGLRRQRAAHPHDRLRRRLCAGRRRRLSRRRHGGDPAGHGPGLHLQVVPGHRARRGGELSGCASRRAPARASSSSSPRSSSPPRSTRPWPTSCSSSCSSCGPPASSRDARDARAVRRARRRGGRARPLPAPGDRLRDPFHAPALHVDRARPVLEPHLGSHRLRLLRPRGVLRDGRLYRGHPHRQGRLAVARGLARGRRHGHGAGARHRVAVPPAQGPVLRHLHARVERGAARGGLVLRGADRAAAAACRCRRST